MGYAVYQDGDRWAGYGVPAECDMPECHTMIDRGMGYKCETVVEYRYVNGKGEEVPYTFAEYNEGLIVELSRESEGCGLFFCMDHAEHDEHEDASVRKPDSLEWEAHMLTDESWGPWRDENPETVVAMKARQKSEWRSNHYMR